MSIKEKIVEIVNEFDQANVSTAKNYFAIYRTNVPKNRFYIGMTKKTILNKNKKYFGGGKRIVKYVKENGTLSLTQDILFKTTDKRIACAVENAILEECVSYKSCLNIVRGSNGCYVIDNDAYRRKCKNLSDAKTGIPRSEETKKRISESHKGKMVLKNIKTGEQTLRPKTDLNNGLWVSANLGKKYKKGI